MLKLVFTMIIILPLQIYGKDQLLLDKDQFIEELELMITPGNITKKLIPGNQPIKLNCINKSWNFVGANITWIYKACGSGSNRGLCDSAAIRSSEDVPLCGVANFQPCSPRLTLDRPSSGLYKCYKMEKKAGYVITASLVNTFQLEIMDRAMKAPEFDEVPEDQTAFIGSTVAFTCKVRSTLPLHVNWYKQVEKLNAYGTIQYEKKFYQSLNVTEVSVKGDIHSQLKLRRVSLKDSGIYACGAINEAGIRYKEAKLIVQETKIDDGGRISKKSQYDEWKWAIIASAVVLVVLLVKCLFCWRLLKSAFSVDTNGSSSGYIQSRRNQVAQARAVNRKRLEFQPETANETSDYEQVFTL